MTHQTTVVIHTCEDTPSNSLAVDIRKSPTHIQYRYRDLTPWTDIIPIADITGAPGASGSDGKKILIQVAGTYLQYKYEGEPTWVNLVNFLNVNYQLFQFSNLLDRTFDHNLGRYVAARVIVDGEEVEIPVSYPSLNQVRLQSNLPISGTLIIQ